VRLQRFGARPPAGLSFWPSSSRAPRRPSFRVVDFRLPGVEPPKLPGGETPCSCRYQERRVRFHRLPGRVPMHRAGLPSTRA
jgi:hypothetical protein